MKFALKNKLNSIPVVINIIWSLILLFILIFRVPEFAKQRPEGASMLLFGTILISAFLFTASVIYIPIANLYKKVKIYYDLYFAFISVIILTVFILLRL
jgi:hypothetical protein